MQPEAIILGSGTSNGVPMLGVDYPPEFLANPKNHRTRSSCLLRGPSGNLLIDCAPEMRLQLTRHRIMDVEAVLITHTHADHVMGMDDLRSFCMVHAKHVPVYAIPRYQEDIRRIYRYAFAEHQPGIFVPKFQLIDLPDRLEVGGLLIETFQVEHGRFPVAGIRVGDFAYITDVSRIPPAAWGMLSGLDTLVIDAVRFNPHPNHFNFEGAMEVIAQLKPSRAVLTHLSHDYDHDAFEATLPDHVRLAYDGMTLPIRGASRL